MLTNPSAIAGIIGSVALFLASIIAFDSVIKEHAHGKIQKLFQNLSQSRLKAFSVGFVATAIVQSSTAMSVLLAGLADTGFMTAFRAIPVIFGVNVGTAVTSQLIAFDVMSVSPYIIILGLILRYWTRAYSHYGKGIIYFGLLFLSIDLISYFVTGLDRSFIQMFLKYASDPVTAIAIGFVITQFVQSSSVVTGLVIVLAGAGSIDLLQSLGLILGANIGTTTTALIVSFFMNREAKKVALSHLFFNLVGVTILLPFLSQIIWMSSLVHVDIMHQIADFHIIFNLICAVIFMILFKPFYWLVSRVVGKSR